ncbi:hypothetical protein EMIT0P201_11196 [Pseudomonas chlororaphis]
MPLGDLDPSKPLYFTQHVLL